MTLDEARKSFTLKNGRWPTLAEVFVFAQKRDPSVSSRSWKPSIRPNPAGFGKKK